ncbi:WxL protein peptidoglycan domain-containing protein [Spirilliplanes yamanashiensis]|uniref:DUF916 domain-containing protein n=1 Tax=Spirilliplanes yamanashiensis TaxID=42233 RepID=A0A8J4DII7_9ACTN|nr:DUF916 domain-containing protein [Spirilliplanes yamanashiensis]MDP9814760.1 hypothetical protein [Spirilliplanes yamanashiensis]GIJ02414.1 hypothetical protein Sya03_17660 [Spirilliplanes yamanashiensis]
MHAPPRTIAAAAAALVLLVPAPVAAAPAPATGGAAWSVQPSSRTGPGNRPFFAYDLAPGGTVTDYVGVTNLGSAPLTLNVYGSDAFTTPAGGYDLLPADRPPVDVGSWLRLARTTVTVPPRSRADIPFTLTAPANASPGDHAGGIVASVTSTAADASGHSTRLEQRVGARIYLRVNGALNPGLRVDGLRAAFAPGWTPFAGRLTLTYTARNTGNVRLGAGQTARVEGLFGLPAGERALEPLPELLPGAAVERTVVLEDVPALVRLSAAVSLAGHTRSTAGTWALSWWYALPLLLVAGAVVLLVRRRRRRATPPGTAAPARQPAAAR